jgi:hypothetical protein
MNQFPPALEYSIKTVANFFENSRRYAQVKVHHQYQRHRWQIFPPFSLALLIPVANFATGVNDTGGKFATGVNDASGKLPPVSMTPAANWPPVSLAPVAYNGYNIRLQTSEIELEGKNLYIY